MFSTKNLVGKILPFSLIALAVLGLAAFVYATADRTRVTSQELKIVPGQVTGVWSGMEQSLINDVSEESLYQDFSPNNSAYLQVSSDEVATSSPDVSQEMTNLDQEQSTSSTGSSTGSIIDTTDVTEDTGSNTDSTIAPTSTDDNQSVVDGSNSPSISTIPEAGVSTEENNQSVGETASPVSPPEMTSEPSQTPQPEPTPPESALPSSELEGENANSPQAFNWRILPSATYAFPLAQAVLTDYVSTTPTEIIEIPEPTPMTEEQIGTTIATSVITNQEDNLDPILPEEELPAVEPNEEASGTTSTTPEVNEDNTLVTGEILNEEEPPMETPFSVCATKINCAVYPIEFSGFSVPEFESGTFVTNVDLRLSLAAKLKANATPQQFVVEYTYNENESAWKIATIIDIEDEISNSINGGYFLISLGETLTEAQLANLKVRVSYLGDSQALETAYLESAWLEITSSSFYEEGEPDFGKDMINYSRNLEQPAFHQLFNNDEDVSVTTLPSFTLDYSPQQNVLKRIATAIFSENTYQVSKVEAIDSSGVILDVPIKITYQDDTTWTLAFLKQPQKMKPGKYKLRITVDENDSFYVDEFEFYWGVLAVNTTKSMYFPGEKITLNLAALTDKGDTICDANLQLKIISPSNSIYEVPVNQSGACGKNNVTNIPDYLADFTETNEIGRYTIQLQHLNKAGEIVHKIQDHFEVRDYIPYDIERTAPTRIYPPSPYTVKLDIKANRTFTGDITERVPRGFVFADVSGAEITSLTDATLLTWKDITMQEGDKIQLSYVFDAPDISPYTYLLGPLDMAGFQELRQWQIASDALNSVAYLTGTSLTGGTELNNVSPDAIVWSTTTLDSFYFSHSTSTPQRLNFTKDGDYLVSLTMPIVRTDNDSNRVRFGTQLKLNDSPVPYGISRTGYIRGDNSGNDHSEASNNPSVLLTDIKAGDYLTVFSELITTYDTGVTASIDGQASLYVEFIGAGQNVFSATTTYAIASTSATTTNLNETYPNTLAWTETRQDTGFVHSDSLNPQNIIISDPGSYLVEISVPLTTLINTTYLNVLGRVLLDGVEVSGGKFATGRITGRTNTGDAYSSLHWSGIVTSTTTNQVLTITGERESAGGAFDISSGYEGAIYVQKLPTTNVVVLRGNQLVSNSNDWNPATAAAVEWEQQDVYDSALFTHSTSSNPQNIVVNTAGDYFLTYNDALTISAGQRQAPKVTIYVNGTPVLGAQTKTNYLRYNVQNHSSAGLSVLLPGLTASSTVTVMVEREANTGVVNTAADAIVMLWKKAELNFRPTATAHNQPFDNVQFSSTTPSFSFTASDPDGSSNLQYEFQIATSADFVGALDKVSGIDAGFQNIDTIADTSPFNENEDIVFQLQPADSLSNNTTYYWRVRAKDVTGSNEYGDWTTTKSLTVKTTNNLPRWYQTKADQFLSNTIIGLTSVNGEGLGVDTVKNSEAMLIYGERTDTQVKYRFWNGTTWGSEVNGPDIDSEIYWAESAAGITRDEYTGLFLTADGHVNAMVYSASTSSWGNQLEMTTTASTPARRGIGLAYESISGKAMAVSCSTGADPIYSLWNGSSWSATTTIDVAETNDCNWLTLAADPVSDEIIMLIQSAAGSIEALVWDGSAWGNSHIMGRLSSVNTEGLSVVYEESGDQAVVVTSDAGDNEFLYSTWNGTDWQSNLNVPLNGAREFETGHLVRDEGTDRIGFCFIDNGPRVNAMIWDGDAWGTQTEISPTSESATGRGVDCEFETVPGRDGYFLVAYSTNATDGYQYFDGTSWSGPLDMSDLEEFWYLQTARTGDGTILAVGMQNVGIDPLGATEFNGTYWSSSTLIEADPADRGAGSENESFSLSAKRFSYAQGIATTLPIDFTSVPNQPSWGDLAFNTTEPVGTNILVRFKYSSSTACDTYIPNGSLAGNDSGFESNQSPINLTGLSTTTYSQICLEATISRNGEVTPTLNDWTLSWVREPKLIQNSYRWYVNGSFLTPTDPWPVGVTDLAEKLPLVADQAISIDETIRLRLSLEGLGVATPTSTESFKLQYAPGLTCSAATNWQDVGDISSTTALWRGYSNAIVGLDWYDADWSKRVKITIDKDNVTAGLTDFPVYVNLANLPNTFFSSVQADGDDIRVTKDDGLTEVPFELVSIDTSGKKGELYFKADISSTTDSKFFIYYGNSSASGYSVTATYGRNNTWDSNYSGVWHMNDVSNTIIDSTGNGYTGTKGPATASPTATSSPIGQAQYCDGNDYIDFGDVLDPGSNSWTVSTWFKPTIVGSVNTPILYNKENMYEAAAGGNYVTYAWQPHWAWDGGTSYTTTVNAWYHSTVVYNKTNQLMYKNGSQVFSRAQTGNMGDNTTRLQFCARGDTAHNSFFTGVIDEMRMSKTARSAAILAAEYSNQANPAGFYAVSAEELISDGKILPSTLLASSTLPETYEEFNPTRETQNLIAVGNNAEWDFALQNHDGAANTNYCFRLVYEDGRELAQYRNYPRLITNAPPLLPDNLAPFDNEQTASTSPWFDFSAEDDLNNDISYQIEIDNNYDFSSPEVSRESNANFSQFTNLSEPAERGIYTAGQVIRFIPNVSLSNGTTYWWRVRGKDDNGSGAYGSWSTPTSVTIDTTTAITTWFQTTEEQFASNNHDDSGATGSGDVRINSGFTAATTTSTAINFSDVDTGNAWGEVRFVDNESSGDIKYFIEYEVSTGIWDLIPDSDLPSNSSGFDTSPVSIANVSPVAYPKIRLRAVLTGNSTLPQLQSWSVLWGQRIEPPTHLKPFANAKVDSTTPTLTFKTTDPQGDSLQYQLEIDTTSSFTAPTVLLSGSDPGFSNVTTPADVPDYNSGDTIKYIVQSALSNGQTYWWRLRARDPGGENAYSDWSAPTSFTVDTALTHSTWYQTTGEQFNTNDNTNIEPNTTEAKITTTVREAMVVYGESTSFNPKYRLWSGSEWSDPSSALGISALVEWAQLKAAPTRSEYGLSTVGNDGRVIAQIYNGNNSTWGNQLILQTGIPDTNFRVSDVAYETVSGKLLALACDGSDALYATWNGTSWSATSSINLANANDCNYIKLASNPTSNEIIAVFRHTNTSSPDYEALVWNGSSWGHSNAFGNMSQNANEGLAVEYEASGDQAVVVVSNGNTAGFLYDTWDGSNWSGQFTQALQDDFEHGVLKRDVDTDRLALCAIDIDGQVSQTFWNGAAWGTYTTLTTSGNSYQGRPVSCEFETTPGRVGYLMIPYSTTLSAAYQYYATSSYSGELPLGTITDAWTTQTIRTADGLIMAVYLQDTGSVAPTDRFEFIYWNGTAWTGYETLSGVPSVVTTPISETISMAPRTYINFDNGVMQSTPIKFADGDGPRWQAISWHDTKPGASTVKYRVYYETTPDTYALIPNSALSGNSTGFTSGPIDISALDTNIYKVIKLEAELNCVAGDCPTIQDWSVDWSEGIIVSGTASAYDQVTPLASGTVAIAINGVLQNGKTAQISSGVVTEKDVFSTVGTSTFTVPVGVSEVIVKAWGAGGGGGAGGPAGAGASGGGGGYTEAKLTVTPGENLTVLTGGAGQAGEAGSPAGGAGGGGYSAVYRGTTSLMMAGAGGGGGGGVGGVHYAGVGTACTVTANNCTPTVPSGGYDNDVLVAVVHSRTDTAHTCITNCAGWTEFSTQAGTNGRLSVWYLRRGVSTPPDPTFSGPATDSYSARIWAFRGVVQSGNPFDVVSANTTQAANVTYVGSSLTSTVSNSMMVFVGGSVDDNTWGPGGGACTVPNSADPDFYVNNTLGNDNSAFLCFNDKPTNSAGPLSVPSMTQATLGPDAGRWFTFNLRPETSASSSTGLGGVGGGLVGGDGGSAGDSTGGGGGTQSTGGSAGGGSATAGTALYGGNGGYGVNGGAGGVGGTHGGGAGGKGDSYTAKAGGGGAGGGYFGAGGGEEAASSSLSGAGGGGGSSYIYSGASATSTESATGTVAGNNDDVDYASGVALGGSGGGTNTTGSSGGNGRVVISYLATTTTGTWSISNVNVSAGDVVTVFIDGASSTGRAVAVTKYDGAGDITEMELNERHLTIGSADNATTSNANLGLYDTTSDNDIFFDVNGSNVLTLCAVGSCADARLKIKANNYYQPGANGTVNNFQNYGNFLPQTNTLRVGNEWQQFGNFTPDASTIIFTATTSSSTLQNSTSTLLFNNVTFGEGSGNALWNINKPLITNGTLAVNYGTLVRGTSSLNIAGNLTLGANGYMSGLATTTFDGSGTNNWSDAKPSASSTNVGNVVIDGTAKTIALGGNVGAESVTIGSDDTLNSSGSGYNINVVKNWTNLNLFVPQTGTVTFIGTSTGVIARGVSPFNNLSFTGVGGNWSFSTTTLAVNGDLTIATGTVTLPTGTTTVGRSFLNTGGTFAHNNGEVRMTSTSGGRTITQNATAFLNAFYDLVFTGSGAWSFGTGNATTTHNFNIQAGTVTLPSGNLTVGGDFNTSGSGAFVHNSGTLTLLTGANNILKTNGSSLNNLNIGGGNGSWLNSAWGSRVPLIINASQVVANQTDFPIYVNLDDLPDSFFSAVKSDGSDIRVTKVDGQTQVPFELVSISTSSKIGELYFKGDISSTTDTTYYIYFNNPSATAYAVSDTYGRNNVWTNSYEGVWHMNNTGATVVDSTGKGYTATKGGGGAAPTETTAPLGKSQSFDGNDYLDLGNVLSPGSNNWTISVWYKPTAVGGTQTGILYNKEDVYEGSAGGNNHQYAWMPSWVWYDGSGASFPTTVGNWYYAVDSYDKSNQRMYKNGVSVYSRAQTGNIGSGSSRVQFGARGNAGHSSFFTGEMDEIRMSSAARSANWIATEYLNQSSSSVFYTVNASELKNARVFTDTNATILGNYYAGNSSEAVFPTGVLSIGGSFDNDAQFSANNGTVKFNSTAGAETVDPGLSDFSTLEFNSATGDFTITQNATATKAINLSNVQQFTLSSGKSLTTLGSFNHAANGSNTTWTGSTLRLSGATTTVLNSKTHGGDVFDTLEAASTTLVKMWNSSANNYLTNNQSAIYSQDHAGGDGDLYIFGNYNRTTGTEYWSAETDFDGTALGSLARAVKVRVASSSSVGLINSSLNLVGTSTASTSINSQIGTFGLSATNTTITAQYFTVSGTNANGFGLLASSTLTTFNDGSFTVAPNSTGITIDRTTVNTNPSAQLFRIAFATSSPGSASNVTYSGATTSSYIWFRNGSGSLYGEDNDANDGNPGSLRFDDSSNSIIIAGKVYADDGVTPLGAPTCDGVTPNVRVVVNGGTYIASTTCAVGTGNYSFPVVNYIGDPRIVVYLNTNGGVNGSVVTKTPSADVTNMDIYANRVIVRHEDITPLKIADMVKYDSDEDALDLKFTAATGTPDTLLLAPNTELYVFASSTFAPGGNITLGGNGNANSYEGTLALGTGATFTASSTETHTLAGRLVLKTSATLNPASSTIIFSATTTGKSITAPSSVTLNDVQFNGVGGGWNIGANLTILGNMTINQGTVTGTGDITMVNGSLTGNGLLSLGSGTTTINKGTTLGGNTGWTFANLVLGNGLIVGTTTLASNATTTVLGKLTISNAHFLQAGGSVWDLAGTGNVFTNNGTFLAGTSTIRYSGAGANVTSLNYYNLLISAGVGTPTYTAVGSGLVVNNNLEIGGATNSTFDLNANDPALEVKGNVNILGNGTLNSSNSGSFNVLGNWSNSGVFNGNGGTVNFTGSATTNILAGNSAFSKVIINGTGNFNLIGNATTTDAFTLTNHNNFTVNSGQTLAVGGLFTNSLGGGLTTWTGATLALFGNGTYQINASTTSDTYDNLRVASTTQIRMWNSSALSLVVDSNGSLYSQDHAGADGELYIWGKLQRTTGNDYWSYSTDFDGSPLTGGSGRQAKVYLANGASANWNGSASLTVLGSSSASTTVQNQGSGTYDITFGSGSTVNWNKAVIRNTGLNGITFAGTPSVIDFSYIDQSVDIVSGSAITVGGTAIDANPAKNFTNNIFNSSASSTYNVTATGTALSSWRFTNHTGNIAGEAFDNDPTGDPGYLVWDNSAALISVSGNVYSDEGSTVSSVCDGVTTNVRLVVAGITTYDASCNGSTGAYTINNVAFSPLDTLTLYLNGTTPKAANVTIAPISSIYNMNLYENRVIVRHENTDPITIANMAVWDSSDDADIPFTAVDAGTDTLTLPADRKLLVWSGKTLEPNGNVTLSGGGGGASYDGTLEAQSNATFRAKGTETHSIGGSLIFGSGAQFISASSTFTLTTSGSGRTIDVNSASFNNLTLNGSGSWNITDTTTTLNGNFNQSAGTLTFGTGTSTFAGAFNATGGSFNNNGSKFVFVGSGSNKTVKFNNSAVADLTFDGSGSWNMTDTNATNTGSLKITQGTITLPSGSLSIGGDFENLGGAITHNTSDLIMTATSAAKVTASSSTLFALRFMGPATYTLTDRDLTLADSFEVASGSVAIGTGTLAVGGSFTATGGTFSHASGTVLLNAASSGKVVNPGSSTFYNLQFGAPSGGYTLYSATTTNNLTLASASSLVVSPSSIITVGGVFSNSAASATTWTNTTLNLFGANAYTVNNKSTAGDTYSTLNIGSNSDIRMWSSSAVTTNVASSSSLYSQDQAGTDGLLYIYGDLPLATSTEYWSYATDFDGAVLTGGSRRQAKVYLADNATTTLTSGSLQIIGALGNETEIQALNATGIYTMIVNGGTFNANYYKFRGLDTNGLQLNGLSTISDLTNGYFEIATNTAFSISLSSTTLNANPSKVFTNVGFNATNSASGYNVNLSGDTVNAWRFPASYGAITGEAYDIDGFDDCGSIRFDDSDCLLTEQTHFRWRNDDGGEAAPSGEWFDTDWNYRQRVRLNNKDAESYATTAVKINVTYDSNMKADFSDLRFTGADGLTELAYWIERYTASTDATIWVKVPSLVANSYSTVFMYYGNSSASSTSSGTSTFPVFDDYEDNSLSEYGGDTSLFQTDVTPVYGGSYALEAANKLGRTTDGIYRTDQTVEQGQRLRWMQYVNTSGDEACTLFGVQSPGSDNKNYAVCLERFGANRLSISKDVTDNDASGAGVLASSSVTFVTGWYEVEVDWRTDDSIRAYLYKTDGTLVASTTATDSSYTSGGYGYTFWFQNGSWDSFTARPRVTTPPTVYFGVEQTNGGASWASLLDAAGSGLPGDKKRLRFSIENSGIDITGQQFKLEYALKSIAPTCESVSGSAYLAVPNISTCGTSPICMATSSNVSNGDATTDQLFNTAGTFSPGAVVSDPSSQTASLDVNQRYYTELEYVLTPTINATDAICLRLTNAGTELDFYNKVAELGLKFDPQLGSVALNEGNDILLTPGTTTTVFASTTVTDFNGYTDLTHATATIYRSGAGAGCSANDNDCYILTTDAGQCTFSGCSGNSCDLICKADMEFYAEPTDYGSYEGQEWLAYVEVEDAAKGYDFASALGVELTTLRALDADSLIDYGTLEVNSNTGSYNASTTITNLGNVPINIDVESTDLSDGGSSLIPASEQKMSTSTFSYSSCVSCYQLSSSTPVNLDVNLSKPTVVAPPVETDVYWGIAVPYGVNSAPHSGTNIFTPVSVP